MKPTSRLPIETPQLAPVTVKPRRLPGWRLWLPLCLQAALIVSIPAQSAYTYFTGRQVTLQTMPVDPYDLLRGYSQTLGYDISRADRLKKLSGGEWFANNQKGEVYVVLQAPTQNVTPPKPWQAVRVSGDRPTNLKANQVALKGQYLGGRITYGLEGYYMPEDQRNEINAAIRQVSTDRQAFVVDVKVDERGRAVPDSLWVRDRNYRF